MTAATNEDWIQNSLARLEALEAQREQLAATGQHAQLAELDEEIRSLYEALEAAAGDDDEAPANEAAAAPVAAAAAAAPMAQAPVAAAAPMAQATAAAPMAAPSDPFGGGQPMAAAPAPGMAPMGGSPDYVVDDVDIKPPRSPLPIVLVVLLLVGGGVGAYFMLGKKKEEPKPEPTGPAVVIEAGAVVEDTQEPVVAKGADGDRTRGTNFKEGSSSNKSSAKRSGGGGNKGSSRPRNNKKDDGRKVEVKSDANDPLAGI